MIAFPDISPEIFRVGPIAVRWYGLMYVIGFSIGYQLLIRRAKAGLMKISLRDCENIITYMIVGMLVGARIFYVFLYNWDQYKENWIELFYIWQGGLSFHGAAVGMVVASALFARSRKIPFYMVTDSLAYCCAVGYFFGRVGNFINGELFGRPTDAPWGMIFPTAPDALPRHPSQLYQGLIEGLLLYFIMRTLQSFLLKKKQFKTGLIGGVFLVGYGLFRTGLEFFREPDKQLGFVWAGLSMGQVLSLLTALAGVGVLVHVLKTQKSWVPKPASDAYLKS